MGVVLHGTPYEITTYRLDGNYQDHRHPDRVQFCGRTAQDLARRDFTINAMAYAPGEGCDRPVRRAPGLGGGYHPLRGKPGGTFCRGCPAHFAGAALFGAAGLYIGGGDGNRRPGCPGQSAIGQRGADLCRTGRPADGPVCGQDAGNLWRNSGRRRAGSGACIGCTQPGRWHCYDVWQHTAAAVTALDLRGQDTRGARVLRWATFLHDIAKPLCRSVGPDGAAHFKGHNQRGAVVARTILCRLKAPSYLLEGAIGLIAIHDAPLPTGDTAILKCLNRYGAVFLRRLCALKYADLDAHARTPEVACRRQDVTVFETRMTELSKTGCYTIRQLAVNGSDLMAAGLRPGRK